MSTRLEAIKHAIETLPAEETLELKVWLLQRTDFWDRQMIEDIEAGRFQPLFGQLDAELAAGELTEIEIPQSFRRGMAQALAGMGVDMETALRDLPPTRR